LHTVDLLEHARKHFLFSAYQCFSSHKENKQSLAGGFQSYSTPTKVTEKTYFDIGSITKAVCTTSILARLFDRKLISLDEPIGKNLKGLTQRLSGLKPIQLLTHTSGLKAWMPTYEAKSKKLLDWYYKKGDEVFATASDKEVIYSDIGFLLLGLWLEAQGKSLKKFWEEEVVKPLKLKEVQFGPMPAKKTVATEFDLEKGKFLHGVVFDENSRHWGGVTPHAGLFSTAKGLAVIAEAWLKAWQGESDWLSEKTAKLFTAKRGSYFGDKALGWDTPSQEGSTAGKFFSPQSFGHLGFTGTSLWIDPVAQGYIVFFTNRVHPSRYDDRIRNLRPELHNAIRQDWES